MLTVTGLSSKDHLEIAWDAIVRVCNRVLQHADIHGFQLMDLPDPDVKTMYNLLTRVVIPIFESFAELEDDPDSNRIIINLRQYLLHLRNIVSALDSDNEEEFDRSIELLRNEAMI